MAFDKTKLVCYNTIGIRKWAYSSTTDNLATMDTSGYFNAASDILKKDDVIEAIASDGYGILHVNSVSAGVVDTDDAIKPSGDTD